MTEPLTHPFTLNTYRARLIRYIDADTLILQIDLGYRKSFEIDCCLDNVALPQLQGPEGVLGRVAAHHVITRLDKEAPFLVRTRAQNTLGRWMSTILFGVPGDEGSLRVFNQELVTQGYGLTWDGRPPRPNFDPQDIYPLEPK